MSEYVKSTNFTSKDSLAVGNPLKIIKGAEFDTEFNNIATAVATKADLAGPALTGVPTAPTAAAGTSTPQLATTAFVQAAMQAVYPVGSIYINAGSTSNPNTLLGFGTWVAFGAGRVMVGLNGGDALFDSLEETGGSKDAVVVAHSHTASSASAGEHTHTLNIHESLRSSNCCSYSFPQPNGSANSAQQSSISTAGAHTHGITVDSTGSSGTNANLQPYITVAMWKRTA